MSHYPHTGLNNPIVFFVPGSPKGTIFCDLGRKVDEAAIVALVTATGWRGQISQSKICSSHTNNQVYYAL